jgi:glycosyltransferase involved in cell wall biosynthesis
MVSGNKVTKVALVYNTSSYLYRFRKELVEALHDSGYTVLAVVPDVEVKPQLEALGARCISYRLSARSLNPLLDLITCFDLFRIFRKHKPQIVLNFTIKPVLYGSLSARMAGVERICSMIPGLGKVFIATNTLRRALRKGVILAYKAALLANNFVFFQNTEDKALFIEKGIVRQDQAVMINGSGVNLEDFRPSRLRAKVNSFILISRIFEEKGIRQYVEAARSLKKEYPHAKFCILGPIQSGGGITAEELADWVREGVIDFPGEVDDVRPYLSKCSVFVLPTYYREGLPRSIIEAMAMGKPIITTDWPGCRETVVDGENGYLVPVKDVDALICAMRGFLDAPDAVDRMGKASREIAARKYDVHAINKVVMSALTSDHSR